ncbi:TPA: TraR/DksA family transcriptional regulator [Proteus mirabilis]|uniref:TraR/DksA family transcriptional regulator n=1 Tax=Proteus vulgaris TaxID=585 RepID=UPI000657D939|nr:TraR/DksA family transcriptional regulator [Proteus vulgaris]CRL65426.1 hypothetical protein BN1805_03341 [Proteus vulgaris]HCT2704645.1 TraR/DksA family transcriptional regulator [Proteus mirabilis]HCU0224883.1 TraR/DksA family transcriptional regulator [Proteus mirabilis]
MSKEMDLACEQSQLLLDKQIKAVTGRCVGVSAFECEDCGREIPEKRRIAVMGCIRCADCQTVYELKSKHYRSV